ncbi:MAG: peroxiredoxin [Betaproteobacteria bacterium HGW-Betaproteobacteria-10]|nr:MAG: peroxiredoxin [Betaproteobacteria bacterium HGW-Betaproteobacteria-10]
MNADQLKAAQAPLKAQYLQDPESAKLTLAARGRISTNELAVRIETGHGKVLAGLHPGTGGTGEHACSGDMLLESLAACSGVTLKAVATAMGISFRDATVTAEGDLDFRGTLGVAKDAPVGFSEIRLKFTIDTDATDEQLATLLRLSERYCVIYQTLKQPPILKLEKQRLA